ncbi:adenylate/guanylate cyclase domain protein (macronuclear) [Tetrahymena thermophila SB210]|uniref:Adenylate/guanylate cyclase domain protein n=1 Tax=Tetrahymena thermophila (strain SB210) TaxID=312017 RepID=I7M4N4_TETTS|nr:adenylate/guanylate cyclase domain protein [Tetrahymena thermophila SB210]EAS07728.2 adenylate/guanylate cyclase domain protein [Tetrahymena thermophila SB210]|eukprot:XP_001027970.2 adenylate/guanylate cyclase domain protein [Tetrahymena thermophila SB210]
MSQDIANIQSPNDNLSNHSKDQEKEPNNLLPQAQDEVSVSSKGKKNTLHRKLSNRNDVGDRKGYRKVQFYLEKLVDSSATQITMTIVTIYALFGDDIRVLSTDKQGDEAFWIMNCICLALFTVEIIINCIAKKGYFNSFFFYLDIISTVSLILDIGWISDAMFNQGGGSQNAAQVAKAGRASRVGTRAGRVVRIVRLIRLVKLYKLAQQRIQLEAAKLKALEYEQKQLEEQQNQDNNPPQQQELGNNTVLQKRINNVIMKERVAKTLQMKKQTSNASVKQFQETDAVKEIIPPAVDQSPNLQPKENEEQRLLEEQKALKSKLPPLNNQTSSLEASPNNVPSKPVVLEKYKDDPLLQVTNVNTDQNEQGEKKDVKKMAKDIIQINQKKHTKKYSKASTIQRQAEKEKKQESNDVGSESKVGQKLTDLTTQRVIVIVLCIMISIPIFDYSTYYESQTSYDAGLLFIYYNYKANQINLSYDSMKLYLDFSNSQRNPILYMSNKYGVSQYPWGAQYPNSVFNDVRADQSTYREDDKYYYTMTVDGELISYSIVDIKGDNQINAILSIIRTIFVSIVLTIAFLSFSSDVEHLVLEPIASMMKKVRRIADNPLEAAQIEEREALALEQLQKEGNLKQLQKLKDQEGYETVVLEKLIMKIGALLALGFGEAGSEIIASNMSKGGSVDPMIPGKKIMAIFGFCDIRNFTDATEVLQTGVMLFVNEIAEITHSTVDSFCGQSNKNIGDAFLLVWKYGEDDYFYNSENQLELKDTQKVHNLADLPVLAFLKIMAAITISKKLFKYRQHKGLNERLKNYRVKMGFGLHVGWAIEGAIGSGFKIDASYLSPNVNMASRLEAATKQFGTGLLISGPLYKILTPQCQNHLRHIDRVTVKGSLVPLDMYTVDVHLDNIVYKKVGKDRFDNAHLSLAIKKKKRVIDRMKRNKLKESIINGTENPYEFFNTDKELVAMREFFTPEFYSQWQVGFKYYLDGKWPQAKEIFQKTLVMLNSNGIIDGPSNTLIEVIEEHGNKAPSDWNGFRVLTEK